MIRLNEAGYLSQLTRITSVSGGSVAAGQLALAWRKLNFVQGHEGRPVATNLQQIVIQPLRELLGSTLDLRACLYGMGSARRTAQALARLYAAQLFAEASLGDLPTDDRGPRFVFCATDLRTGSLIRFSRAYIANGRDIFLKGENLALSDVIAASSSFPPIMSPLVLDLPSYGEVTVTDGGLYDNLGLETVLKNYCRLFVSDGGAKFNDEYQIRGIPSLLWQPHRVIEVMEVQARRLRKRQLITALESGVRKGAYWSVQRDPRELVASIPGLDVASIYEIAREPTRLRALPKRKINLLIAWGYANSDASLRSFFDSRLAPPMALEALVDYA